MYQKLAEFIAEAKSETTRRLTLVRPVVQAALGGTQVSDVQTMRRNAALHAYNTTAVVIAKASKTELNRIQRGPRRSKAAQPGADAAAGGADLLAPVSYDSDNDSSDYYSVCSDLDETVPAHFHIDASEIDFAEREFMPTLYSGHLDYSITCDDDCMPDTGVGLNLHPPGESDVFWSGDEGLVDEEEEAACRAGLRLHLQVPEAASAATDIPAYTFSHTDTQRTRTSTYSMRAMKRCQT